MVKLARRSTLVAVAGLAGIAATGAALAADMPVKVKAPPPVVYYDWSGAYVGFSIGGVWSEVDRFYPFGIGGPFHVTSKGDDVIYDFHAGAQGQWGNWVLGIEAGYAAGFKEMRSIETIPPSANDISAYNKITNLFTVGPRLGFAWDRWMIYGTGGYAIATLKGQYIRTSTGLQISPTFHGQSWNDGWFAGAGFEYMVHKGALVDVVLGAEYQHFDVRSKNAFCVNAGCNPPEDDDFSHSARGDIVRARLTIKTQGWGWAGPAPAVVAKN
jgi:outer membrane immunogenic protein